jgi:hypothetical protein
MPASGMDRHLDITRSLAKFTQKGERIPLSIHRDQSTPAQHFYMDKKFDSYRLKQEIILFLEVAWDFILDWFPIVLATLSAGFFMTAKDEDDFDDGID